MNNVRNFTYEGFDFGTKVVEAFEAPKALHPPAPPPSRPVFTAEEIELAKTLAREEGLREGQELAKKQYDDEKNSVEMLEAAASQRVLEEVNAKLGNLHEESQNSRNKFSERLGKLALAMAQKVCGDVSAEIIERQITAIINESVARLAPADKIKIYLSAKNAAHLNDKFTHAEVSIDEKMQPGDFRLEWKNGFAERDVKELWQSIGEICSRHSSLEENETNNETIQTIKEGE